MFKLALNSLRPTVSAFKFWQFVLCVALCADLGHCSPLTITGAGATAVEQFFQNLTATASRRPGLKVIYKAIGANEGRKDFIYNVVNYAASGIPFTPAEEYQLSGGVKYTLPTVLMSVTVFTRLPGNPTLRLTASLLSRIFQRQIITWDHPAILWLNKHFKPAKGLPINVVVRKDKCATTELFNQYMFKAAPDTWKLGAGPIANWPPGVFKGNLTIGLVKKMKYWNNTIGYSSTSTGVLYGLTEAILKNPAGNYLKASQADLYAAIPVTLPSPTASWAAVSLLMANGPQTWPITTFMYVFARQNQVQSGNQGGLLYAWLQFLFSDEVQGFAADFLLYPVPRKIVARNLAALKSMVLSPMAKVPKLP